MGGGGGFFTPIVQAIGDVVNAVGGVVGKDNIMDTPAQQRKAAEDAARREAERVAKEQQRLADERATIERQMDQRQQVNAPNAEGGTPTALARQGTQASGSAAALSESQQAVNQTAGSGTMLTGNMGVDPNSLELGRKTLLGG